MPKAGFTGGTVIGALRHIVVADTEEDAIRIGRPAFEHHIANLNYLRNSRGSTEFTERTGVHIGIDFDQCVTNGMVIAGDPELVCARITGQAAELGINYLLAYLFFGTMTYTDAQRSLSLFAAEVMPRLQAL